MVNTAYALLMLGAAAAATGETAAINPAPAAGRPVQNIELAAIELPRVELVLEAIQIEIENDLQDRMNEKIADALIDVSVTPAVAMTAVER